MQPVFSLYSCSQSSSPPFRLQNLANVKIETMVCRMGWEISLIYSCQSWLLPLRRKFGFALQHCHLPCRLWNEFDQTRSVLECSHTGNKPSLTGSQRWSRSAISLFRYPHDSPLSNCSSYDILSCDKLRAASRVFISRTYLNLVCNHYSHANEIFHSIQFADFISIKWTISLKYVRFFHPENIWKCPSPVKMRPSIFSADWNLNVRQNLTMIERIVFLCRGFVKWLTCPKRIERQISLSLKSFIEFLLAWFTSFISLETTPACCWKDRC